MRQIEERARGAAQARPVYLFHKVEIGRTEVEASAVEHDGASAFIYLPQSAPVGALLAWSQHVTMQIDAPELQYSFSVDPYFRNTII